MKENLPFDDFVKKQFSNYSPDVPAHIWKNIIEKRKPQPKGFWFGNIKPLILSLIILSAGGTYLFLSQYKKHSAETPSAINSATKSANNSIEKRHNSVTVISENTIKPNGTNKIDNTAANVITDKQKVNKKQLPSVNQYSIFSTNQKNINNTADKPIANAESEIINNATISNNGLTKNINTSKSFLPHFNNTRELTTKNIKSLNIQLPQCPALEDNAAANKKYWEVYAGPDYAFDNYKSYGDTANANYLQKRKASTKFASAFSAGIRYTKVFNNSTSVRAGVNYTQVNEKFTYFNPNEIKYITVITTRVVIRSPGDTIYINDTLQYQQTGARTKTTYNRYRNIDVPIVVGYELGNGKIHANINAGVIINIYSWYKGDVLDSLYQPVSITTGKGNTIYHFKNNIGVGFLGSVSVYYKINDKIHLLLEPYFRYNLSPMSKQNLNLQQKTNIAGLRAGVRFDLK